MKNNFLLCQGKSWRLTLSGCIKWASDLESDFLGQCGPGSMKLSRVLSEMVVKGGLGAAIHMRSTGHLKSHSWGGNYGSLQ